MSRGEFLTRITIWVALCGYAIGAAIGFASAKDPVWHRRARWAWTIGCFAILLHLACAFHFYHGWSQSSAYLETARQTRAVTGSDWGGGLFINYGFIAAWVLDVFWWWRGLEIYRQRPLWLVIIWHSIFLFIVFNATVVFKTGLLRWLGLGLCVGLVTLWWWATGRKLLFRSSDKTMVTAKD